MTYNMTMKKVNVHEAKARLSEFLASGERVVICNRNVPVAELRPLAKSAPRARAFGLCRGEFEVSDAFFEPLDPDLVRAFHGEDA